MGAVLVGPTMIWAVLAGYLAVSFVFFIVLVEGFRYLTRDAERKGHDVTTENLLLATVDAQRGRTFAKFCLIWPITLPIAAVMHLRGK